MSNIVIHDMHDTRELDLAVLAKIRGGSNGISRLVVVTQQKADNAHDADLSAFGAALLGGAIKGAGSGAT